MSDVAAANGAQSMRRLLKKYSQRLLRAAFERLGPEEITAPPLASPPPDLSKHSERLKNAVAARAALVNDFFGGWQPSDVALFEKYRAAASGAGGQITDYFGVRTPVEYVPWAKGNAGQVLTDPPIPDDGVRAEAIEYFALLDTLENSHGNEFSMIELGASYAPWCCMGGVLAMRAGKKKISLRAVEAGGFFYKLIASYFELNGIKSIPGKVDFDLRIIHGAVGIKPGTMHFPVITSANENGGQALYETAKSDYVGRTIEHEPVEVKTLTEIFQGLDTVDLLHCDIQGSEDEVLTLGAELITQKVRRMFIGTHSRHIEGKLIDCFHKLEWSLVRERPTHFEHRVSMASPVGMTLRDGGQYWVNNKLLKS